jgi:dTDP-4-dehydrorhamnose reductase
VNGYTDHLWNGVTTHAFARLCMGIMGGKVEASSLQHVIPAGDVTKADLLVTLARAYGREDVTVIPGKSPHSIDRTLRTDNADANAALWGAAGYSTPPTVEAMVTQLADFEPRLTGLSK